MQPCSAAKQSRCGLASASSARVIRSLFPNSAKPLRPVGAEPDSLTDSLAALRAAFRTRARVPCFEFIEEFAPDLGPALAAAGFDLEERYPLLVCTPETLRPGPPIPGLTITTLTPDSPAEDLLACLTV